MREYHVAKNGHDSNSGSNEMPFLTISRAAQLAQPGDTVIVHEGVYRENVSPKYGGRNDLERIVYTAAPGEKAVIKGSEIIKGWVNCEGSVWKAELPNAMFGSWNPYKEQLIGDWLIWPVGRYMHPGDVYLNGRSFYEAEKKEDVFNPQRREVGVSAPWVMPEKLADPDGTIYQWFAEVDEEKTVIYANFQGADPNEECAEINVRRTCFYPDTNGINYITVRGFEIAQAACPWTPPTADQPGMVGPNWAKGWIIEDNILHDAKCSAVSLGKEARTGHNVCTFTHRKPGYQCQMESVFEAVRTGWSKETIGSHIVRNNTIYDCGQNGVVGHMGCIFSRIENNHIFRIGKKYEFFGHEIAAIKLHAALDTQLIHNRIHDCSLGTWLDWQAQGARLSSSLYYNNGRDLFIEVTHGPLTVDNNIFMSDYWYDNVAQGTAYVHNLICGLMSRTDEPIRTTPYHYEHSTQVRGTAFVYSGDDRWYQNVMLGGLEFPPSPPSTSDFHSSAKDFTNPEHSGTANYNGSPISLEEYIERVLSHGNEDLEMYVLEKEPAYINGNAYLREAAPFDREKDYYADKADPQIRLTEEDGHGYLEWTVPAGMLKVKTQLIGTAVLGTTRITEGAYENPDGTAFVIDKDINGVDRTKNPLPGPFADLNEGYNRVQLW